MTERDALNAGEVPGGDRSPEHPGSDGPGEAGAGAHRFWESASLAVVFLLIVVFMAADVAHDWGEGASGAHVGVESALAVLALGGFATMWRRLVLARRSARALQVALDRTRADLVRWRSEAQAYLHGLGVAIDSQFDRWGLSPAEREVGLLLLKGLSLREVAEARHTSERTVRQQALALYRKGGLAGRAELAAFFLEDLLLPREGRMAAPARRG